MKQYLNQIGQVLLILLILSILQTTINIANSGLGLSLIPCILTSFDCFASTFSLGFPSFFTFEHLQGDVIQERFFSFWALLINLFFLWIILYSMKKIKKRKNKQ